MPTGRRAMARCRRPGLHAAAVPGGGCRTGRRRSGTARERYSRLTVENGVPRMSLSFAAVEVPRVRLARDIKVDGREAPNRSRDGAPSGPGGVAEWLAVTALDVGRQIVRRQGSNLPLFINELAALHGE